jgi:DNA-binding NarL/FixJ family response regulator
MPSVKLIFLTMNADVDVAGEAFRAGASAYLLKNAPAAELLRAVHDALRGKSYVTPQISRALEKSLIRDPGALDHRKQLTDREREVLQLLAEGRPVKEIADILRITVRTVRFHKYRIMEVLDIGSTAEVVQYAIKHAMITLP